MVGAIQASPSPAVEGSQVQVSVSGGSANTQVTIRIVNGDSGNESSVTIELDGDGEGATSWEVPPGWSIAGVADFDAPGMTGDSIIIDP